jgi:hypothetical protein
MTTPSAEGEGKALIVLSLDEPAAEAGTRRPGRGAVVGFLTGAVAGCVGALAIIHGGTSGATPASSGRSAVPARSTASPRMSAQELLAAADQPFANGVPQGDGFFSAEQASLLSWPADEQHTPRGLRDVSDNGAPPGTYTMSLYCIGEGHVVALLRIGSAAEQEVVDCTSFPRAAPLSVTTADGGGSEVMITAVDGGTSAVSYLIRRSG